MEQKTVWLRDAQGLSAEEKMERLGRISIGSPAHLKQWLRDTGRLWLVFNTLELVDSLPFPSGVDSLIQLIACYRDHRRAIPTGRIEVQVDPAAGVPVEVPVFKGDMLELEELIQAVRYLVAQIRERNPSWNLESQ